MNILLIFNIYNCIGKYIKLKQIDCLNKIIIYDIKILD